MNKVFILILIFLTISVRLFSQKFEYDSAYLEVHKITINDYKLLDSTGIDTAQNFIQNFDEYEKMDYAYINLGQSGTPALPMIFLYQNKNRIFPFVNNFYYYFKPQNYYYSTNKPYTSFKYLGGLKYLEDQYLDFLHTQSPDSSVNFGIYYKLYTTQNLQSPKDNSSLSMLDVWYYKKIKAFNLYIGLESGRIKRMENGGYIDTSASFDPTDKNLIYYLSDVNNQYNQMLFTTNLEYNYREKIRLVHSFNFRRLSMIFYETNPHSSYFGTPLISTKATYDSTGVKTFDNSFSVILGKKGNLSLSIINSLQTYYYFRGFLYNLQGEHVTDNYVKLFYKKSIGNFNYHSSFDYHLTSIYSGDIVFKALQSYKFNWHNGASINLYEGFSRLAPEYFYTNYNGNYDYWKNNFQNVVKTEANISFIDSSFNLKAGYNYNMINNYIFIDTIGHPAQLNNTLFVNTFYLKKTFNFHPLVLSLNAYYQKSNSDSVFNLPKLVTSGDIFFDFGLAKDNLHINIGANVVYYSGFYEYRYNPALGFLYPSFSRYTGNYPFVNLFVTGKIKSAVIIVRLDNAGGYLFAPYHETVEHYHIRDFLLRFGVQWWFRN